MTDLADRCATVVQRYGSLITQWTGDGIMAVFGAPMALEDHATRYVWQPWAFRRAKRLARRRPRP